MSDFEEAERRVAAAVALQQSETRLRLMIDAVPAMITYLDTEERFLFCNKCYLDMLGLTEQEVLGRKLAQILGPALHAQIAMPLREVLAGSTASYERRHVSPTGAELDLSVTFVPHKEQSRVVGFFSLTLDVTKVKALERKLGHLAGHDVLTGLPNRMIYAQNLAQAIERNRRHNCPFALVLLDVDHFKAVNDTHGHAAGDQLLQAFAQRLANMLRKCDVAARIGGDEFALILDGPINAEQALAVAAKIVAAMRMPFRLSHGVHHVSASIGVSVADDSSLSAQTLEARADAALYRVKASGRDNCLLSE